MTWDSSLSVNQVGLTGPARLMVTWVLPWVVTPVTSSGMSPPPGWYMAQLAFSACSMLSQNITSGAPRAEPFDHRQGLSVTVTVVSLLL